MAYTKTNWQTGDVITAEKLNHMEDGIADAGGVFVLHEITEGNVYTLDHTWQEIYDAMEDGTIVVSFDQGSNGMFMDIVWDAINDDGSYTVDTQLRTYVASSSTEYPSSSST